jgi:hypothetical protein
MLTLRELGGTLNIVGRLRAWGQARGFAAANKMLTEFEGALHAKGRVLSALEDLTIKEDRLRADNLDILLETARRGIDYRLAEAENILAAERARGRQAELKAEIEELRLEALRERARKQRDRAMGLDEDDAPKKAKTPEQSIEEKLTALTRKLNEKQAALEDATEADAAVLKQEISMILMELEALRLKHAQSL